MWRGRPRPRDGVQCQLRPFDFAQGRLRGAWSGSTLTPDFRPGLSPSAPLRLAPRLRSGRRQKQGGHSELVLRCLMRFALVLFTLVCDPWEGHRLQPC
jgi:hypothetical protein